MRLPARLNVSVEDASRGFVVIREPIKLELSSNTAHGVELDVTAPAGLFSSMHVQGRDIDAILSGEGGTIAYRWSQPTANRKQSLDLRFTVALAKGLQPGTYPWPIAVYGRALETFGALQ
jgi:hypothetical protein